MSHRRNFVALSGGVGGAKLVSGLATILPGDALTVVVNTGDDFNWCGLRICPDLDSVTYALAGVHDVEKGWGRRDESWNFMAAMSELQGPDWFRLGDRDMAMHVMRSHYLQLGRSLTVTTALLTYALGIRCSVLPMCDEPVETRIVTAGGTLPFQEYFVRRRCEPAAQAVQYAGAQEARMPSSVAAALVDPGLAGVILCPSNPYLSIDPILSVPGMREALRAVRAPVVAVSPYIRGAAIKGPAAKLARELGAVPTGRAIAERYGDFLDGLVAEDAEEPSSAYGHVAVMGASTLMHDVGQREVVAQRCLDLIACLQET